jgi:hypothetical protein
MAVGIRGIAKHLGISVSTVSAVINNRGYVSPQMRVRVEEYLRIIDYQPNYVARSLRRRETKIIGLIVPDLVNSFYTELSRAAEDFLSAKEYKLIGRPYYQQLPGLNTIYPIDYSAFNLNYNALQTKMEKRFSHGFNILVSYTYAHDIGSAEGDPGGGDGAVQNPYNLKEERGNVDPDFRHYFFTSYLYQLPFGKGRYFGSSMGRVANAFAGDWEISGITTARTGEHFTPCLSSDDTNTGTFCAWADKVANPNDFSFNLAGQASLGCPAGHRSLACWYNQAAFTLPPLAPGQLVARQFGNSGNGSLVGPDQVNFNVALLKSFDITESNKIQFRAEVYNLANHPQFALPGNSLPGGLGTTPPGSTPPL